MGWQYRNGQVTWVDDPNWRPPLQTPQNTTNSPAYGATPDLPGAGSEYIPPGSPTARTNGAIQAAGAAPMQSPLTGASGVVGLKNIPGAGDPAFGISPTPEPDWVKALPPEIRKNLGDPAFGISPAPGSANVDPGFTWRQPGQTGNVVIEGLTTNQTAGSPQAKKLDTVGATGDVTGDPASPLPSYTIQTTPTGPNDINLPGLPSGRDDLAQLLTIQQLNQQQGNPMLELLQGLSVQNLAGPFGLTPSEEQLAYGRGEAMLRQSEAEQQKALIEEMNRRGILTSGITVDQLANLAGKGQLARQNLLSDLLISNAQNQQAQRNAALGTAGSMYGIGQAGQQQNFGNLMGLLQNAQGWQGQQFGQQQQVYNDALNNYYRQMALEAELNSNARAEELQPYQLLMQLAGLGESATGGLGAAGNLALGAQGQALANQDQGINWGSVIGSVLPSLLALL